MVRVQASAEGFSTSFTVFILAGDQGTSKEESDTLPEALRSAIELEAAGRKNRNGLVCFTMQKMVGSIMPIMDGFIWLRGEMALHGFGMSKTNGYGQAKIFTLIFIAIAMLRGCTFLNKHFREIVFYNYTTEKLERFAEK